jgi:hypothetical protein
MGISDVMGIYTNMIQYTNHGDVYGGFLNWGYPNMGGLFHGKFENRMDENWGYPQFRNPPYKTECPAFILANKTRVECVIHFEVHVDS